MHTNMTLLWVSMLFQAEALEGIEMGTFGVQWIAALNPKWTWPNPEGWGGIYFFTYLLISASMVREFWLGHFLNLNYIIPVHNWPQ